MKHKYEFITLFRQKSCHKSDNITKLELNKAFIGRPHRTDAGSNDINHYVTNVHDFFNNDIS